ncbi:hypothetical protein AVDCRST_MAG81-1910, partial [uncultured Synechococcales cyanobacterium]
CRFQQFLLKRNSSVLVAGLILLPTQLTHVLKHLKGGRVLSRNY